MNAGNFLSSEEITVKPGFISGIQRFVLFGMQKLDVCINDIDKFEFCIGVKINYHSNNFAHLQGNRETSKDNSITSPSIKSIMPESCIDDRKSGM
jgi:hypothetical protein